MLRSKWILAMCGLALVLSAGCKHSNETATISPQEKPDKSLHLLQRSRSEPPDVLNDTPLIVDGAMQLRDWGRSTAFYTNGDTVAGPTGFLYEPRWYQPEWRYAVLEAPLSLGQTIILPIVAIFEPPWEQKHYTGATIEPTSNAMPAVPPPSNKYFIYDPMVARQKEEK
jgi:hypothetical protein